MKTKGQVSHNATLAMLLVLTSGLPCFAQDGKLTIHATPKQSYVFVDDHAVGEASRHHSLKLSPGDQGIPADHLDTQGLGDDQNLTAEQVKQSVEQNPELNDEERQQALEKLHTLVLANNRRVDIKLSTTGQESAHQYPFKAEDFAKLVNRNDINKETVQLAAEKKKIEN